MSFEGRELGFHRGKLIKWCEGDDVRLRRQLEHTDIATHASPLRT